MLARPRRQRQEVHDLPDEEHTRDAHGVRELARQLLQLGLLAFVEDARQRRLRCARGGLLGLADQRLDELHEVATLLAVQVLVAVAQELRLAEHDAQRLHEAQTAVELADATHKRLVAAAHVRRTRRQVAHDLRRQQLVELIALLMLKLSYYYMSKR